MATRPTLDPTKAPAAALTMAYQDHEFLARWVGHYGREFGRQHLYVLSHGADPEHRRIAEGCNVIGLPRDPTLFRMDRRRWSLISQFAGGLLRYYNWVIAGDVDELVIVDPAVAAGLVSYLDRYDRPDAPASLCPFGVELVHTPASEPEPIDPDRPILSVRRNFRANANYSKPCVLRKETMFTAGGHANMHQPRILDPHLYLLHLRFYDQDATVRRLTGRKALRDAMDIARGQEGEGVAWSKDLKTYRALSAQTPVREDADLAEFRARMVDEQQALHDGKVIFWGGGRSKELYSLPERFASVV